MTQEFYNNWVKRKDVTNCVYFGTVVDNSDVLYDSRVRVRIPKLHDGVPDNVIPYCRPHNGSANSNKEKHVDVPPIGANVEVIFENDDFYNGIYIKGIPDKNSRQDTFYQGYPNFRGFKTNSGNIVKWYDNGDINVISSSGESLYLRNGTFTLDGNLTVTGNIICNECTASGIPLSTHKHPYTWTSSAGSGNTSSPIA